MTEHRLKTNTEGEKKKFKAVIVDTTDVMKSQARDSGDVEMTMEPPANPDDLKGAKKFLKGEFYSRTFQKIWKHGLWRDYYRNKQITKAREEILKTGNVFSAEGRDQAAQDKFVVDLMEQFSSEYDETIHYDAGEKKKVMNEEKPEDKVAKDAVKKLIVDYAKGTINKDAFIEEENRLFRDLKADTDARKIGKKEDIMHASNFFQIAEQVKEAMRVGEFIESEDFDIDLIYGKSKAGVRTEAKFTRAEALAEKLSHTSVGQLVNETTIAAVGSIAATFIEKGAQMGARAAAKILPIIGTAVVSAGFAKVREAKKVEEERRQHERQMARGETFDPATMERRKEMAESSYQRESAQNLINILTANNTILETFGAISTPEQLKFLMNELSAVEARIRLSDRRNIDLIGYSDTTRVVEERKKIDIEKAKAKVALRKLFDTGKLTSPIAGQNFEDYFNSLTTTQENALIGGDIATKDRVFNKMKSEKSWSAAKKALVTGLVVGAVAQETLALFTDQTGIVEDALHHNVNMIHGGSTITDAGAHHLTGLAQLKHLVWGGFPKVGSGGALHDAFAGTPMNIKLPTGMGLVHNPDGTYNLLSNGKTVAEHLTINPDGTFPASAQNILHSSGVNIDSHMVGGTATTHVTTEDYIKNHPGATHEVHRSWYDNDTKEFDKNELRTHWGGDHGTGIDTKGDYVLDVSHMTPDGSSHAGLSANALDLMKAGKLKMLISLSKGTQNQVLEVPISPSGQIIVDAHSEIGKIAFENVGGHAKFVGAFAEIAQDNGNNHFTMLSTLQGEGVKDIVDTVSGSKPETILTLPGDYDYRLPPFIPIVPRTPLERLRRGERPAPVRPIPVEPVPSPEMTPSDIPNEGVRPTILRTPTRESGQLAESPVKGYLGAKPTHGELEDFIDTDFKLVSDNKGLLKGKSNEIGSGDGQVITPIDLRTERSRDLPRKGNIKGLLSGVNEEGEPTIDTSPLIDNKSTGYVDFRSMPVRELTGQRNLKGYLAPKPEEEITEEEMTPEFTKFVGENINELDQEQLKKAHKAYKKNITEIFGDENEETWNDEVKNISVKTLLDEKIEEGEEDSVYGKLYSYCHKLLEVTGLEPEDGLLAEPETIEEYMVRALQKATKMGKLEELELYIEEKV